MSLCSSASVRIGNAGFFSIGAIAFALVVLQGCGAPIVTASSLKEPGSPVAGLGALRADDAPTAAPRHPVERSSHVHSAQPQERAFHSYSSCRRCSQ